MYGENGGGNPHIFQIFFSREPHKNIIFTVIFALCFGKLHKGTSNYTRRDDRLRSLLIPVFPHGSFSVDPLRRRPSDGCSQIFWLGTQLRPGESQAAWALEALAWGNTMYDTVHL